MLWIFVLLGCCFSTWRQPLTWCFLLQVICLQSFMRRWLAQQKVGMLKMERDQRLAWEDKQVRRRQEEKRYQMRERHQRWSNPQRQEDFNDLYCSVASKTCSLCHMVTDMFFVQVLNMNESTCFSEWRMMAEQQICSTLTGAEKTAALCSLVQQETQHIAAIGRLQIKAKASNHDNYVRRLLDKVRGYYSFHLSPSIIFEFRHLLSPESLKVEWGAV